MNAQMSLRRLATVLGVSQPFLSQIRAGKRPLPVPLRFRIEALGAYHLLISDKHERLVGGAVTPAFPSHRGAVAQPGERLLCKQEVRGSSPLSSTTAPG